MNLQVRCATTFRKQCFVVLVSIRKVTIHVRSSQSHLSPTSNITQILPRVQASHRNASRRCSMSNPEHSPTGRMPCSHSSRNQLSFQRQTCSETQNEKKRIKRTNTCYFTVNYVWLKLNLTYSIFCQQKECVQEIWVARASPQTHLKNEHCTLSRS